MSYVFCMWIGCCSSELLLCSLGPGWVGVEWMAPHLLIWQQTIYYLLAYWLLFVAPGFPSRSFFLLARFTVIIVVVVYATFILYSFQFVSLLLPLLLPLRRRHCYYCLLLALKHAPFEFALKAVVGNKKGAYIPTYILTI